MVKMYREHKTTTIKALVHTLPAVLADYSVHTALWCQRQNQGASLKHHVYVETAKAWQEHHLKQNTDLW